MSSQPVVVPHVILAHRKTGALRTVTASEANNLVAHLGYFLVCREPEDCPSSLTTDERNTKYLRPVEITLRHCHDRGVAQPDCPKLNDEPYKVLPVAQWQAADITFINELASNVLGCSPFLRWDIQTRLDRRRSVQHQTTIEIFDGTITGIPKHVLQVRCDGVMSASARLWLQQQARRSGVAVIVPATPTTPPKSDADNDDSLDGRLKRIAQNLRTIAATLKDGDDEYSSADFDYLLVKVRSLIATDPVRAALLDRYATQLLNESR